MPLQLESLAAATFRPLIGEAFALLAREGHGTVTLETVHEMDEAQARASGFASRERRPFSLVFVMRGARRAVPQQTCTLEHAALGAFELFLVPLGPGPDGMRYEAIFT